MSHTMSALGVDLAVVIEAATAAGDLILGMQAAGLANIRSKSTTIDLVTEADVTAEHAIRGALVGAYPHIGFWGEESDTQPSEELFWVVDPIDGTTNFANGLPLFAVNIALQHGSETVLGVTLGLPNRRLYWATAGGGAYTQGSDGQVVRLRVNAADTLNRAFITTGFPYSRGEHPDNNLAEFGYFMARAQGVRCIGSAAIDLALVASGATAAYWEGWLKPWDAAPGVLMVREAGGTVTDYGGSPWKLGSKTLVASNGQPALHQALLAGLREARSGLPARLLPAAEGA
jgi:myo-inositol-1(or 4)-monophosphatase